MAGIRRTILIGAAVLASSLAGVAGAGQAAGAATATASISGTVRVAGTGVPIAGLSVDLFKEVTRRLGPPFGNGKPFKAPGYVTSVLTAPDGTYTLSGLPASDASGYWVCFSTFGFPYQPNCFLDELGYDPFPDPLGLFQIPQYAARVHVASGQHVTGVDAHLIDLTVLNASNAGTITGKVTQTVLGRPLNQVRVTVRDAAGTVATEAMTRPNGTYVLVFVPAGPGYRVCFNGAGARGGVSLHGYTSRCRLVPVNVAAGAITPNVNAQLAGTI